jgi:3-oxoacyl-[acyl-carrier protein] reductase
MPEYPFDLTDQVAIITGGGTGIGEATAKIFATQGAHSVIASRKLANLERVAGEVTGATGRRCVPVATDVREEDQVRSLVRRTIEEFGRVDILVNNSGGSYRFDLVDTPSERWDNMVSLNLRSAFVATREAGAHMIEQGRGAIVNISSAVGLHGGAGFAAYGAAKAGLQNFTRSVALEWGQFGVRANCIAVGLIASEGARRAWDRMGSLESMLEHAGVPEDIGYPILFLASEASRYMSGETFEVAGGQYGLGGWDEAAPT